MSLAEPGILLRESVLPFPVMRLYPSCAPAEETAKCSLESFATLRAVDSENIFAQMREALAPASRPGASVPLLSPVTRPAFHFLSPVLFNLASLLPTNSHGSPGEASPAGTAPHHGPLPVQPEPAPRGSHCALGSSRGFSQSASPSSMETHGPLRGRTDRYFLSQAGVGARSLRSKNKKEASTFGCQGSGYKSAPGEDSPV